jgi:hypothetical protein
MGAPKVEKQPILQLTEAARRAPEAPAGRAPGAQRRVAATAQREEIRPRAWVDASVSRSGGGPLALEGDGNPAASGQWETTAPVAAGRWYRLTAADRCRSVPIPRQSVNARLDWRDSHGGRVGQPEYFVGAREQGDWRLLDRTVRAPEGATAVRLELWFGWAKEGTVLRPRDRKPGLPGDFQL